MNKISMLVMDVDGTLTDGKIYIGEKGEIMKAFDVKDGYAIQKLLQPNQIIPVIITGRKSRILERRCAELNIKEVHQGCLDKKGKILEITRNFGLPITDNGVIPGCAYIGDDVLDLPGMEISEIVGCPADAVDEVKERATYVCKTEGGKGAVREFVEWLIKRQKKWE